MEKGGPKPGMTTYLDIFVCAVLRSKWFKTKNSPNNKTYKGKNVGDYVEGSIRIDFFAKLP